MFWLKYFLDQKEFFFCTVITVMHVAKQSDVTFTA